MKERTYSEKEIIYILIIFFVLSGNFICQAQSNNIAKDMSQKLKEKVLLSDSQTKSIENIISDYISSKKNNKSPDTLEKIKDSVPRLLDSKQKIKFEVIKNSWWTEIDEDISSLKAK